MRKTEQPTTPTDTAESVPKAKDYGSHLTGSIWGAWRLPRGLPAWLPTLSNWASLTLATDTSSASPSASFKACNGYSPTPQPS